MASSLPCTLIPNTESDSNFKAFQESAIGALRLLAQGDDTSKEEVEHCIVAATTSLLGLKHISGSEAVLGVLQSCGMDALLTSPSEPKHNLVIEGAPRSFWCHCNKMAASDSHNDFIASLRSLLERSVCLMAAYVRISSKALSQEETERFLLNLCTKAWSPKVHRLLSQTGLPNKDNPEKVLQNWSVCVQNLAVTHVVTSMYTCVSYWVEECFGITKEASTSVWLCSDAISPVLEYLSSTSPVLLYRAYQQWLHDDQRRMEDSGTPAVNCIQRGQLLRSGALLCNALSLLATEACGPHGNTFLRPTVETVLRLGNHYWEHLTKVVKSVPKEASLKVWYLALATAIHLHVNLCHIKSLLDVNNSHLEHFSQLLHCISEFCDGLRDRIVAYHTELCITSILHDPLSHDWHNDKAFFENERCSFPVQMWHYHLLGLKHDLWSICTGQVAEKMLASVLTTTLTHLARRYTAVRPSYKRVTQFRGDILAIVITTASLLPCLSPGMTSGDITSIHRSCAVLLGSLAVIGCSLEQLDKSMAHTLLPHEQSLLWNTPWKWMEFVDLRRFGLLSPPSSDDILNDYMTFVSLPHPKWDLLLKILTARESSFAAALCRSTGSDGNNVEMLLTHIVTVLSHCYHSPHALGNLFTALGAHKCVVTGYSKTNIGLNLLFRLLRESLQSYVLAWGTDFSSKSIQKRLIRSQVSSNYIAEFVEKLMEGLETELSQLPQPIIDMLLDLAGIGCTDKSTPSLGLPKVLGVLMGDWLKVPDALRRQLQEPVLSVLETFFTLVKHTLHGTLTEEAGLPPSYQLKVQRRLHAFGSNLHRTLATSSTDVEHEIMAEVLEANCKVQPSMEFLYDFLKINMAAITELLQVREPSVPPSTLLFLPREHPVLFDPIAACLSLGGGTFDHQWLMEADMDWKGLLEIFTVGVLERGMVVKLIGQRFEFQEGAQLQGREPEFVESIQASLKDSSV